MFKITCVCSCDVCGKVGEPEEYSGFIGVPVQQPSGKGFVQFGHKLICFNCATKAYKALGTIVK